MEKYFAYASNINMRQMRQRCPSVKFLSRAKLKGYRLAFVLWSERWGGGVAGIIPDPGGEVEGVLYGISCDDLKRLDGFESVDRGRYYREKVMVELPDGSTAEAWVYLPHPDPRGPFTPSQTYLETIIEGAREHGLSGEFIERLDRLLEERRRGGSAGGNNPVTPPHRK
ncbi:MAG TPA: gamma-glutamylcyclotransferase [Nitrospirae bacterium]|nr:gamma-glutamylcyclotransferase [Nitrospirota bacterium]